MKRMMSLSVATFLLWNANLAEAGPICTSAQRAAVVQKSIVVSSGFAVVPFAVPVAVPVATVQSPTVLYSYDGHRVANRATQSPQEEPPAEANPQTSSTLLEQKCAQCHGGAAPKAGLDLSNPVSLSPQQRLAAVARVVSDDAELRMPKGSTLSPSEIGRLLQELSSPE